MNPKSFTQPFLLEHIRPNLLSRASPALSSRAPCGRGDPPAFNNRKDNSVCVIRDPMDCRVGRFCSLLAMTKTKHHNYFCHREGEARGDPLAVSNRTDKPARIPRTTMDCRVPRFRSLLAMTKSVLSSRGLKARGDPLALNNRTDNAARVLRDTMDCRVPRSDPSSQ